MQNRPSFQPRYQHGAQAGGTSATPVQGAQGVPSSFLPDYSGDGHGRALNVELAPGQISGDGHGGLVEEQQPVWSGDGRRHVANPMMPVWNSRTARATHDMSGAEQSVARVTAPQGDGQRATAINLSDELVMNVNVEASEPDNSIDLDKSPASETWKLVALVVVFLVWISTASTLLFLYMDRYLFP